MKTWERISGEEKGILFLRVCVELESGNSVTQKGISGEEIRGRKVTDSLLFCRRGKAVIIEHSVNTGHVG